jgi:Fe-S-cluster containining protein
LEMEARRVQRLETLAVIRTGRTPLQLIAIAELSGTLADKAIATAVAKAPPSPALACAEGCAWCCHKIVGTALPEVIRIVAYLRQTLSPEDFEAFRERVLRLDDQRHALKQDKWAAARLPCPLLVDQRCSAYAARPLTCRGYNSSDARACERSFRERTHVEVPVYAPQHRLATFVLDGMRAGLEESNLTGSLLELAAALRIVLTVPDAVERWLNGEAIFGSGKLS